VVNALAATTYSAGATSYSVSTARQLPLLIRHNSSKCKALRRIARLLESQFLRSIARLKNEFSPCQTVIFGKLLIDFLRLANQRKIF